MIMTLFLVLNVFYLSILADNTRCTHLNLVLATYFVQYKIIVVSSLYTYRHTFYSHQKPFVDHINENEEEKKTIDKSHKLRVNCTYLLKEEKQNEKNERE